MVRAEATRVSDLGPTAYVVVVAPDAPNHQPKAVIGGHFVGIVAGLVGYHLFAAGSTLTVAQSGGSNAVLGSWRAGSSLWP